MTDLVDVAKAKELAFGSPFDSRSDDSRVAAELLKGLLLLVPHKQWQMPEKITWREDPFSEINWVAQYHMMRWIDPLRREYERTRDVRLIEKWYEIAASWIDSNPPGKGQVGYAWADMVEAGRALTFCFALPSLFEWDEEKALKIYRSLVEHGNWLADPSHIRVGNHALQQHQGLLVIGTCLRRPEWVNLSIDRAREMLLTAYDDEGVNEEGALQYHQINYSWWSGLKRRIEIAGFEVPDEFQRIDRATYALAHSIRPDGKYELIGDTEEFQPRLGWTPETQYVTSNGQQGSAPLENFVKFKSGYIFGRSGWGDNKKSFAEQSFFSVRFGVQNRIHGHPDGMSITWFQNGESVLVDAGKYAYDHKDPLRAHIASRAAHNSLYLPECDYDMAAEVHLEYCENHGGVSVLKLQDPGYVDAEVSRYLFVDVNNGWLVCIDQVPASLKAQQLWHLGVGFSHRVEDDCVFARSKSNELWIVPDEKSIVEKVVSGTKNPFQGWYSPSWRQVEKNRVVSVTDSVSQKGSTGSTAVIGTLIDFQGSSERPNFVLVDRGEDEFDFVISRSDSLVSCIVGKNISLKISPREACS